jgi:hypothetical protein
VGALKELKRASNHETKKENVLIKNSLAGAAIGAVGCFVLAAFALEEARTAFTEVVNPSRPRYRPLELEERV